MSEIDNSQQLRIVGFPKEAAPVKVVQLYVNDKPTLLCGPDTIYHAEIFREFLEVSNIPFEIEGVNRYGIPMPAKTSPGYTVKGMGESFIQPLEKKLKTPSGESIDYQLPVCHTFNRLIATILQSQGWNIRD